MNDNNDYLGCFITGSFYLIRAASDSAQHNVPEVVS